MTRTGSIWADRFAGQLAVVTGGATGLGEGIAERLACEGARVVILDIDGPRAEQTAARMAEAGLAVSARTIDVADEQSVISTVKEVGDRFGSPQVVVNCAGIVGQTSTRITEYDTSVFDRIMSINLRGSFLISKYFIGGMAEQHYGRMLLIASIAGKEGNPGMCGYSATKAGVIGLIKTLGKEFADTGVVINGLAPAVVVTDLVRSASPKQVDYMTSRIPMSRCGTIDEVAAQAAWIVSRECSFTTGFTFDLSGGRATY